MGSNNTFAQLNDLVALITSAVEDVKSEYTRLGHGVPSIADVKPHPQDGELIPPKLKTAIQTINGACGQLSTTVTPPDVKIILHATEHALAPCLRIAYFAKIAEFLKDKPQGLHISELSSRSGIEQAKLGRVLRLLVTKHCFREVNADVFANNRLSVRLNSDIGAFVALCTDEAYVACGALYDILSDPVLGPSYSTKDCALPRAYKVDGTVWDWYVQRPDKLESTAVAMAGVSQVMNIKAMMSGYPWDKFPKGTIVCDLGGGLGHMSLALAQAFPHLNFVVADTPEVIERAKLFFAEQAPELVKNGRIQLASVDFMQVIHVEADVFYLKHIVHDYANEVCKIILDNVRNAMKTTSKLIVQDFIMQHSTPNEQEARFHALAPAPLLSNFGEGRVLRYQFDILMMAILNSQERTVEEFSKVGQASGFELVQTYDCGELGALEFKPMV